MADDPNLPVAIRITRPYADEDEYLEEEGDLLTRTGVTLVGAQPRPAGVILRFELVLSSGPVLVRGEGRVLGFKANAYRGLGGLALRFTRLDMRSKALVDRAAALRDRRRPSYLPSRPDASPSAPPGSLPPPGSSSVLPPSHRTSSRPPPAPSSIRPFESIPPAPAPFRPAPLPRRPSEPARTVGQPQDRDALLERLRARARSLDDAIVQNILEQGRSRV